MAGQLAELHQDIEEAKEFLESALYDLADMYRGLDPDSDYCSKLDVLHESLTVALEHTIIPEWLKKAAEAADKLDADLDARADALSY